MRTLRRGFAEPQISSYMALHLPSQNPRNQILPNPASKILPQRCPCRTARPIQKQMQGNATFLNYDNIETKAGLTKNSSGILPIGKCWEHGTRRRQTLRVNLVEASLAPSEFTAQPGSEADPAPTVSAFPKLRNNKIPNTPCRTARGYANLGLLQTIFSDQ